MPGLDLVVEDDINLSKSATFELRNVEVRPDCANRTEPPEYETNFALVTVSIAKMWVEESLTFRLASLGLIR